MFYVEFWVIIFIQKKLARCRQQNLSGLISATFQWVA